GDRWQLARLDVCTQLVQEIALGYAHPSLRVAVAVGDFHELAVGQIARVGAKGPRVQDLFVSREITQAFSYPGVAFGLEALEGGRKVCNPFFSLGSLGGFSA